MVVDSVPPGEPGILSSLGTKWCATAKILLSDFLGLLLLLTQTDRWDKPAIFEEPATDEGN